MVTGNEYIFDNIDEALKYVQNKLIGYKLFIKT